MKIFQGIKYYLELIKQGFIKKNYKIFYSQFGEDRIINEILKKIEKASMSMLDATIQKNIQIH